MKEAERIAHHEVGHGIQSNRPINGVDDVLDNLELRGDDNSFVKWLDSTLPKPKSENLLSKSPGVLNKVYGNARRSIMTNTRNLINSGRLNERDFNAYNYYRRGSGGRERYPFMKEVRKAMVQEGVINSEMDNITPEMISQFKDYYHNTPQMRDNRLNGLRLLNIMKDNPKNYKLLSEAMNNANILIPGGGFVLGASYFGNQE